MSHVIKREKEKSWPYPMGHTWLLSRVQISFFFTLPDILDTVLQKKEQAKR